MTKLFDLNDSTWRAYRTSADRQRAIRQLIRRGYRYFVCYLDVRGPALQAAPPPAWLGDRVYIDR